MASNSWVMDIEDIVFTKIKVKLKKSLGEKYKDMFITDSDNVVETPKFPTVYIHALPYAERGMSLDNTGVNAVAVTFQCDVMTNTSQTEANEVMAEIIGLFKDMRFTVTAFPEIKTSSSVYRSTMRCSRLLGADDIL